ncbi:HAMP domain-containing histidine kinase [Desulfovibrio sp. OttesenSCG-928-M16]|nr:HAMP domain-containing histidine kinase [Desulfovibrio sp. OttesenSCG-928-M16]
MSIQDTSPQRYPVGSSSLEAVRTRIHYKMRDYATYRFTAPQSCAINIFFDLAQEFQELEQVHSLAVLILNMFFQYDTELYLKDNKGQLLLTTPAVNPEIVGLPELRPEIWNDSARCYVPVRGREALVGKDPRMAGEDGLMGVLVLYVSKVFESHDLLFLQKFANRLGFCLHNKVLSERNARHVLFLRKLAHDIGHNVITPNMRLKLMLNHLGKQMEHIESLSQGAPDEVSMHDIRVLQHSMQEQLKQVQADFNNGALFLESLLRQSHFDLGRYVLRLAPLDIKSMVALQFDRFRMTFEERRLAVRHEEPVMPEPPCMVEADLGLISQALTNLLSNAAKYATPEPDAERGEVRCRVEIVPGAFDQDRDGIKITVFSTGGHIDPAERDRLFEDCYRASNTAGQFGTGHGLFFVRQIVSEHKGDSGYEPA